MAVFDFIGTDISSADSQYNGNSFHDDTATWKEGGIEFSLSHSVSNINNLANVNVNQQQTTYHAGIEFWKVNSNTFGTATLDLVSTGVNGQFSNANIAFSWLSAGVQFQMKFILGTATVGTVTLTGASTGDSAIFNGGLYDKIQFTYLGATAGYVGLSSLTTTISCFLAGTHISTPKGDVAIETLKAGDEILTADGRQTKVKWLGVQDVNTKLSNPANVNPILIKANALADGVPARDMRISGDHALAIDGVLYNADTLINGRTITRVTSMPLTGFNYYHVETEGHELLLAENTPAETFIDYAGRDSFINGDEATSENIAEMPMPRISSARLVDPSLKAHLDARADQLTMARFAAE